MANIGQTVYSINVFGGKLTVDKGYEILNINSSGMFVKVNDDHNNELWYISTIFTDSVGGNMIVNPPKPNTEITFDNLKLITGANYNSLSAKDSDTIYAIIKE